MCTNISASLVLSAGLYAAKKDKYGTPSVDLKEIRSITSAFQGVVNRHQGTSRNSVTYESLRNFVESHLFISINNDIFSVDQESIDLIYRLFLKEVSIIRDKRVRHDLAEITKQAKKLPIGHKWDYAVDQEKVRSLQSV